MSGSPPPYWNPQGPYAGQPNPYAQGYAQPGYPPPAYGQHFGYAPMGMGLPQARVVGSEVEVPRQFPFPGVCTKCGVQHGLVTRMQKYTWVPPWTYSLLLVGLVPAAIVQTIMMKKFAFVFPLCGTCNARWGVARVWWPLSMLVPFAVGMIGAILASGNDLGALAGAMLFVMLIGPFIGALLAKLLLVNPRTVTVAYANDMIVKLRGVGEGMRNALQGRL